MIEFGDLAAYRWIALTAFLFKGYWWFASRHYEWADSRWYFLIGAFSIQNISEFFAYTLFAKDSAPDRFIEFYFLAILALAVAIYLFVYRGDSRIQRIVLGLLIAGAAVLAACIAFTDFILMGYALDTFPINALKGNYYPVYLAFLLVSQCAIIYAIIFNFLRANAHKDKIECVHVGLAISPFLLVAAIVSICQMLGFKINGSGFFPIASSLFLGITIYFRCKNEYLVESDPRVFLPFSDEGRLARSVMQDITLCYTQGTNFKEGISNVEGRVLAYIASQHQGSKSELARRLGTSRQTLDRMLAKYGIDIT